MAYKHLFCRSSCDVGLGRLAHLGVIPHSFGKKEQWHRQLNTFFPFHYYHKLADAKLYKWVYMASVLHPFHICCSSYLFCPTFEDLSSLYGFIFTQCLKTANMCTDRNRWICYYPHDVTASVFCSRISIEENRFQGCANVCPLRLLGG